MRNAYGEGVKWPKYVYVVRMYYLDNTWLHPTFLNSSYIPIIYTFTIDKQIWKHMKTFKMTKLTTKNIEDKDYRVLSSGLFLYDLICTAASLASVYTCHNKWLKRGHP